MQLPNFVENWKELSARELRMLLMHLVINRGAYHTGRWTLQQLALDMRLLDYQVVQPRSAALHGTQRRVGPTSRRPPQRRSASSGLHMVIMQGDTASFGGVAESVEYSVLAGH